MEKILYITSLIIIAITTNASPTKSNLGAINIRFSDEVEQYPFETEVEYIDTKGVNLSMDTGYYPPLDATTSPVSTIFFKQSVLDFNNKRWLNLFDNYIANGQQCVRVGYTASSTSLLVGYWMAYLTSGSLSLPDATAGTILEGYISSQAPYSSDQGYLVINGIESKIYNHGGTVNNTSVKIRFGTNGETRRFYYWRLLVDGSVKKDLRPVRMENGAARIYDFKNKIFMAWGNNEDLPFANLVCFGPDKE